MREVLQPIDRYGRQRNLDGGGVLEFVRDANLQRAGFGERFSGINGPFAAYTGYQGKQYIACLGVIVFPAGGNVLIEKKLVVLDRYGDARDDVLLWNGDGDSRRLAVFPRQLDFGRGGVAGFVANGQLESARIRDFGAGGERLTFEFHAGFAGLGDIVFPGRNCLGPDLQVGGSERYVRACDDVHGVLRNRDYRRFGVLRLYRLVASARHRQERGHHQYANALPHRAEHISARSVLAGGFPAPEKHKVVKDVLNSGFQALDKHKTPGIVLA